MKIPKSLSPATAAVLAAYYSEIPMTGSNRLAAALRAAVLYCSRERRVLLTIAAELETTND